MHVKIWNKTKSLISNLRLRLIDSYDKEHWSMNKVKWHRNLINEESQLTKKVDWKRKLIKKESWLTQRMLIDKESW